MMFRKNINILESLFVVVYAVAFLSLGSSASANDYHVYGQYIMPEVNPPVANIGGYVEDMGVPTVWGDEIQYVYFVSRDPANPNKVNAYKVRIWMTDGVAGDTTPGRIDPLQHPDHPHPHHNGPVEKRNFEVVVGPVDVTEWTVYSSGEFHVDSRGAFIGPSRGIHLLNHNLNYIRQIGPAINGETFAYDPDTDTWFTGNRNREIYQLRDTDNDGDFMDENWQLIFIHPDYNGGAHHDGLEYVSGYLWISDMTSDNLARWQYDSAADTWSEIKTYSYTDAAHVEGMGFGPNGSFWISAGFVDDYFYEIAGQITQDPVADAGEDVDSWPPTKELEFDGSGSYHPEQPDISIVWYEWDFDGDGVYDYEGLDPIARYVYPVVLLDPTDPNSIDWDMTPACYTAKLRVTDSVGSTDVDTRVVCITAPPWEPEADPDGPYEGRINKEVCLDGSQSSHPASTMFPPDHPWYDEIVLWEWDLDGDGIFGEEGETGEIVCAEWDTEGTYFVTLRVTDGLGATDEKTAVVVITAIHDVAVDAVIPAKETDIHECDVVQVDVMISNLGDFDEGNFSVKVYCDADEIGEVIVESLAPEETKILTVMWDTTGVSAGTHNISADADVVPGEILDENNSRATEVQVDNMRTLNISSSDYGSVTVPGEGDFLYEDGTSLSVEATPDDHCHFVEWTGTAVDAGKVTPADAANATVAVEGICGLTLKANFAIDTHTLTTSSTSGGAVTTPGEGTNEYNYGEIVDLAATVEDGYHFVGWVGPVNEPSSEQTTVEITGDTEVKAMFALEVIQEDTVDSSDNQEQTYFLPPDFDDDDIWSPEGMEYYRMYSEDWSWTHTFVSPPDPMPYTVNSATLEIEAWDVDPYEINEIYGDGLLLGHLETGDERWQVTKIELNAEALEKLMDGAMVIEIDISSNNTDLPESHTHWRVAVRSSKLTVNYDQITEDN